MTVAYKYQTKEDDVGIAGKEEHCNFNIEDDRLFRRFLRERTTRREIPIGILISDWLTYIELEDDY